VADVLIDLGLQPIEDIPQISKTAQDAFPAVALVLKRLQEALDSDTSPWDGAPQSFFVSPLQTTVKHTHT
jgi:hypothetical protein